MTVHELIAALLTVPNQNATVTVRVWMAQQEVTAVRQQGNEVELDWRRTDGARADI